jgi:NADH-quinone oxidoreductase subunit A
MLINYCVSFAVLNEYIYIIISMTISLLISVLLYSIVAFFTYKQYDLDKLSSFECGFHPFEDTREKFNIRFYLVSILFIIFDLEITFLFPWAINLQYINLLGY